MIFVSLYLASNSVFLFLIKSLNFNNKQYWLSTLVFDFVCNTVRILLLSLLAITASRWSKRRSYALKCWYYASSNSRSPRSTHHWRRRTSRFNSRITKSKHTRNRTTYTAHWLFFTIWHIILVRQIMELP